MYAAPAIQKLIDELLRLPGIGPKSAARIAHYLLSTPSENALRLASAIEELKEQVHLCPRCFNYAQGELCDFCASTKRDEKILCVVAEPRDIEVIERSGAFKGIYHVLGGTIAPMEGIGPDDLHITELLRRLALEDIEEVVLALSPNVEGETTASYLSRLIKPIGLRCSRLASGLPVGGELEFADEVTLARAIEDRREY